MNTENEPRFFTDIRNGCGAVRDRLHPKYDKERPGLQYDTADVVEWRHGYKNVYGYWNMKKEDIKYLRDYCKSLNGENN